MGQFSEIKDKFFWRAIFAELFATAFFVFNVTLVLTESNNFGFASIIVIAFAIGMSVSVIAQTFGPICGAHLNPAVTIGVFIHGGISAVKAILYIIVQMIAGMFFMYISKQLIMHKATIFG